VLVLQGVREFVDEGPTVDFDRVRIVGDENDTDELPGFGVVAAVIALFAVFLIAVRRRRNGG
jgi:PGF-CTERM protein